MARKKPVVEEEPPVDPTAWLIDSGLAEILLMHTVEIKYMCMFGYTYLHGSKLFASLPSDASLSYKFVSMILKCTGGGILVPIFINSIPVPLAQDAYPIAIMISFLIHQYLPKVNEIMNLSALMHGAIIVLYEILRASVVVKLTAAAGAAIAPSEFSFPLFGPIFCGTIAGCGGAFLPLNKGLDPIKNTGLGQPMLSAFIAATFYHLFTNLAGDVIDAPKKAHVIVAEFFISWHFYSAFWDTLMKPTPAVSASKKTK